MPSPDTAAPVLELRGISKTFRRKDGEVVYAVKDANLNVHPRETVALVGESGSGKTTLSRIALALMRPDAGEVILQGKSLFSLPPAQLRDARVAMQPVFQDSTAAFNPRRTVHQLLAQANRDRTLRGEPLTARIVGLLEQVRLRPGRDFLHRFPHELSGGQRQRLAIARAISMDPVVIVADEPLSGADVSIRGQLLNLLLDLQSQRGVGYLFITHDMLIARAFAHRVAVMYQGSLVEIGSAETVTSNPQHPYAQRLVEAAMTGRKHMPLAS